MKKPKEFAFRNEKVGKAALRVGRMLYTGESHGDAYLKILDDHGENTDKHLNRESIDSGFTTDSNRFVGRKEAFHIAVKSKQAKDPSQSKLWPKGKKFRGSLTAEDVGNDE